MKLSLQSLALFSCYIFISDNVNAQNGDINTFEDQMTKMRLDTALIVQSQAVDEHPLWSKDGKYLAANVAGKWYKIDLKNIILAQANWRNGKPLGVLNSKSSISEATSSEIESFKSSTLFKPREYITKEGKTFQLRPNGLRTEFVITEKGGGPVVKWTSDSENCHSFTSNTSEKYIAFICELNGVFIYMADK